ncbi:hypothetical protein LEP1GSC082_2281 [Leptospira kirschneri str. H2]|uniref:Uncharacterized protein n=2 Tax=Leptospira kirschneri TaxID=29507 RepID=A0A0E2AXU5_9LEPT|nr:hypothetical protein LEP1GSC081_3087 [Leptospira kirschneri str. H1]EKO59493.1 hypothetical protein LEP1GSC082_2281 [Leptospira kirschneri str. H2]EMK24512.1 hypothetical protein LEP1GSC008_2693 [Leptospira kirschneri serovar Bulgarica str. Nikolaevo]
MLITEFKIHFIEVQVHCRILLLGLDFQFLFQCRLFIICLKDSILRILVDLSSKTFDAGSVPKKRIDCDIIIKVY